MCPVVTVVWQCTTDSSILSDSGVYRALCPMGSSVSEWWGFMVLSFRVSPQALNAEEARLLHVKEIMQVDERKRPYNSIYETREPTEEEMEAYRMKRQRPDDPMASFLGQ